MRPPTAGASGRMADAGDAAGAKYLLLSDAAPLPGLAHGCHRLSWNLLSALDADCAGIITKRPILPFLRDRFAPQPRPPTALLPQSRDLFPFSRPALAIGCANLFLLLRSLGRLKAFASALRPDRIFAFAGADPFFLTIATALARATRLPADLYLVDDFQSCAPQAGAHLRPLWLPRYEKALLARFSRIFTISPGFAEHLLEKHRIHAHWLPIPAGPREPAFRPYVEPPGATRSIVFVGAINFLYESSLHDILQAISAWNGGRPRFRVRLDILTYDVPPRGFPHPHHADAVRVTVRPSPDEMAEALRSAWATVLPYSHAESARTAVRTSFSTKYLDSMEAGRPIWVVGPADASIPRLFIQNGMPLVSIKPADMIKTLGEIERADSPELVGLYAKLYKRFHAPAATREFLAAPARAQAATRTGDA